MLLNTRCWGEVNGEYIVCLHGLTQHGGIFGPLAERLAGRGHCVLAIDLRGHGKSGPEPPWSTERHVQDVLETLTSFGGLRAIWIGHSFGGRVAAAAAAAAGDSSKGLVLLDPGLEIQPEQALQGAEVDRLDWSFETREGAINALLIGGGVIATSRDTVAAFVEEDVEEGNDGRYRFSFCPSAVVAAWSEMCLPAPPIAEVRTLVVCTEGSLFTASLEERYRAALASKLSMVRVPNGHNVLWESAEETIGAVERFLEAGRVHQTPTVEPLPGYIDASGSLQPLL
jgi:lipase